MSKYLNFSFQVAIADDADPEAVAEAVFDFLCADPDDLFPQVEQVDGFDLEIDVTRGREGLSE